MFICDKIGFVWGKKLNIYFLKEFQMSHHLFYICCFYRFKYLTKLYGMYSVKLFYSSCTVCFSSELLHIECFCVNCYKCNLVVENCKVKLCNSPPLSGILKGHSSQRILNHYINCNNIMKWG